MTIDIQVQAPKVRKPRKQTRAVKVEAQPAVEQIAPTIEQPTTPEVRVSARPRRVEPDDVAVLLPQFVVGSTASEGYLTLAPGDAAPGVKEIFWRTVGRALDAKLPNQYITPLILAFEGVLLSTASPGETARRFAQLADDTYALRRHGHALPTHKDGYNDLQAQLCVEHLSGFNGSFIVGSVEHLRRVVPDMVWRLREAAVLHLLAIYRDERALAVGSPEAQREIEVGLGEKADRLGNERRRLVAALGAQKASALDAMLVNAWYESAEVLAAWVDSAINKKAPRQLAAALATAHARVEG